MTQIPDDVFAGLSIAQQATKIMHWLALFHGPADTFEIRVVGAEGKPRYVKAGWFTGPSISAAKAALDESNAGAEGVYFTLNPVRAELAKRWRGLAAAKRSQLAEDADVMVRRWLLVDIDPKRPAKVSSTAKEKIAAFETADRVRAHMGGQGFPPPIWADSGNGFHLYYRIDFAKPERLPVGDDDRLRTILVTLARDFNTDAIEIDTGVFNPSRICKLPGTVARKGDSTPDRPHRRAVVIWPKAEDMP